MQNGVVSHANFEILVSHGAGDASKRVACKPRNAPDPGPLRILRRFHTSKPWLLYLPFSTYLTPGDSPDAMNMSSSNRG